MIDSLNRYAKHIKEQNNERAPRLQIKVRRFQKIDIYLS